ncbi:MAG: PEP-CTERM sorting domain-containing protein [Akkermansia sp.]|nr:PEP-CTERM sorting domain-containing protein [Akkermansia sp.]
MKKTLITLLALASVASAALNDTQLSTPHSITLGTTAASISTEGIITGTSYNQAFTAVMTLDAEALAAFTPGKSTNDAKKTPLISWTITNSGDDTQQKSINISVNNNSSNALITTAGFYYKKANNASCSLPDNTGAGSTQFETNGAAATSYLSNVDWTNVAGAALTISYNGISSNTGPLGVQLYFSVMMNDGTLGTYTAGSPDTRHVGNEWDVTAIGYDPTYLDALTIYDGYATAEQAWQLNKDVLPNIPEPTTATLSLLALAGLAMRRRRK